jgi:hypothetical protein
MTWAISHPTTRQHSRSARGEPVVVRWPRGLWAIGTAVVLVSAWGALVPFLGPAIGFHADDSPSWNWSDAHFWLYVLPGAVGFLAGLAIAGRARAGRAAARLSIAFLGLVLGAVGAWFALGPDAWPVVGSGTVFSASATPLDHFTAVVGYNVGVGLVLALLGGMVLKAGVGERDVVLGRVPTTPYDEPVPAEPVPAAPAPAATGQATTTAAPYATDPATTTATPYATGPATAPATAGPYPAPATTGSAYPEPAYPDPRVAAGPPTAAYPSSADSSVARGTSTPTASRSRWRRGR